VSRRFLSIVLVTNMTKRNARKKKASSPAVGVPPTKSAFVDDDLDSEAGDVTYNMAKTNESKNIDELFAEIGRQREEISVLTTRLNFVLSMFGINPEQSMPVRITDAARVSTANNSNIVMRDHPSTANTLNKPAKSLSPTASFQGAVLSTMYREKKMQESRVKNFVVSGLTPTGHSDDKTTVTQLCQKELNVSPEITSCRRLGKVIPGKVQPLLVTVDTEEQASTVIRSARNLRRSHDSTVRDKVYINPYLTKAQADAAYQARCHRRQMQAARNTRSTTATVAQNTAQYVQVHSIANADISAQLNPMAAPFDQSTSHVPADGFGSG